MENAIKQNENKRLYAIGDVHGRLDLLDRTVVAIKRDVDANGSDALTITLGDYIDRGPKSRGVIDRLIANPFRRHTSPSKAITNCCWNPSWLIRRSASIGATLVD